MSSKIRWASEKLNRARALGDEEWDPRDDAGRQEDVDTGEIGEEQYQRIWRGGRWLNGLDGRPASGRYMQCRVGRMGMCESSAMKYVQIWR